MGFVRLIDAISEGFEYWRAYLDGSHVLCARANRPGLQGYL